jgi:hypothetical protein
LSLKILTVGNFIASGIHWSVRKVTTLLNRIILSITSPGDTLLFQKVHNAVTIGTGKIVRVVTVPSETSSSNMTKVVGLL